MSAAPAGIGAAGAFGIHSVASRLGGHCQRKLLVLINGNYDAFVTVDKNLPAQQKSAALSFGVVALRAASNQLSDLKPLVPQILMALKTLQPGTIVTVPPAEA